ncbi:MAG: TIR domain-containing protein [Chloroflexi bacterium]|nr:TIR domain-containing protein [Chloroflexota bacterium]
MNKYEVALSFAGEQRHYVEEVARGLQSRGIAVFYDEFEKVSLWGKSLTEEFHRIFENDAGRVVMFISRDYVQKAWPRHERRSVLSKAVHESTEYVLPVRFDDTKVPGLPTDVSYLPAEEYSPSELAAMIGEKLGVTRFAAKASDVPPPRMTSLTGEVVFDYGSHNGRFVIGRDVLEFETKWSRASNTSIYVYNDPPSINGVALAPRDCVSIGKVVDAQLLDFTSRSRTPQIGQIVMFRNTKGFYAAVQILGIKHGGRGDDNYELRFRYVIQSDGSDDFTSLSTSN